MDRLDAGQKCSDKCFRIVPDQPAKRGSSAYLGANLLDRRAGGLGEIATIS